MAHPAVQEHLTYYSEHKMYSLDGYSSVVIVFLMAFMLSQAQDWYFFHQEKKDWAIAAQEARQGFVKGLLLREIAAVGEKPTSQ